MARFEPDSATGRMEAARNHRKRAYAERNELLSALAKLTGWKFHIMPASGRLQTLSDKVVACLHTPQGPLAWLISSAEADDHFAGVPVTDGHPYSETRNSRSQLLASLTRKDLK